MAAKTKRVTKKQPNAIVRYYRETSAELRKVSWPTRTEALSLTKVVVVVMILFALFLGGLDFLFVNFFGWLFGLGS